MWNEAHEQHAEAMRRRNAARLVEPVRNAAGAVIYRDRWTAVYKRIPLLFQEQRMVDVRRWCVAINKRGPLKDLLEVAVMAINYAERWGVEDDCVYELQKVARRLWRDPDAPNASKDWTRIKYAIIECYKHAEQCRWICEVCRVDLGRRRVGRERYCSKCNEIQTRLQRRISGFQRARARRHEISFADEMDRIRKLLDPSYRREESKSIWHKLESLSLYAELVAIGRSTEATTSSSSSP